MSRTVRHERVERSELELAPPATAPDTVRGCFCEACTTSNEALSLPTIMPKRHLVVVP